MNQTLLIYYGYIYTEHYFRRIAITVLSDGKVYYVG